MAEDMMNEEMTGMAAPQTPMPEEPMPTEEPAEEAPSKFDMETLMGNFMDMDQERRKLATRLLASPAASLVDEIIGEPVMSRLIEQLDNPIDTSEPEAPSPEGMMAPTAEPMAEVPEPATPMEDEEATPPV
jgi:hypothetical protein